MITVSTNEIMAAGGITPHAISNLVTGGVVVPANRSAGGRGKVHRFHPMQAVGLAVAGRLMRTERGCHVRYAARVIAAFEVVTEVWLAEQFAAKKTHFVFIHQGRPLLDGKAYDRVNVQEVYEALTAVQRDG